MHSIDIYRGADKYVTIYPDDNSSQNKAVMGDNKITVGFELSYEAKFRINDWCIVFGEKYLITENPPPVTKNTRFKYTYTLTMESEASELDKIQYLFYGQVDTLTVPEFSLTGTAQTFIDLFIRNTNRYLAIITANGLPPGTDLVGWAAGEVIQTDYKTITFSSDSCMSALSKIADKFNTEWWVIGKTVHLTKKVKDTGITLKHGRSKGLYEMTRQAADNSGIVTSIYAYGGNKNIPANYDSSGTGRLRLFSGSPSVASVLGSNNQNVYGLIERTVTFDDIFPTRTGKVTSVDATSFYTFIDSTMNFDLNSYRLPGLSPKVVFNTGALSGWQFEVSKYDPATNKITILKNAEETSIDIPSSLLKPATGDEYKFVDIKLPDQYITDAEAKLQTAAINWLNENSVPKLTFSITLDPTFVRNKGYVFSIGDLIWITDNDLEIDRKIRVVGTTRNIVDENKYSLTLSDVVPQGYTQKVSSSIASAQDGVNQVSSTIQNGALYNGRMVIPGTSDVSNMLPLYIDKTTDKIYKKL